MSNARKRRRLAADFPQLICSHIPWERKDFYTVKLTSCGDYPHGDVIFAEVRGEHAEAWADSDHSIAGDTWESTGDPGFVYAMPSNHDKLVEELQRQGYVLDLSDYPGPPVMSCMVVDCTAKDCWYRQERARKREERACGTTK